MVESGETLTKLAMTDSHALHLLEVHGDSNEFGLGGLVAWWSQVKDTAMIVHCICYGRSRFHALLNASIQTLHVAVSHVLLAPSAVGHEFKH